MINQLKRYPALFVILASILWSFDGLLRRSLFSLPPAVVVFYEHLLGALVLLIFARYWWSDLKHLRRQEWLAVAVVALLSGALGTILYTAALGQVNYIEYSVVVLLQQLEPIWAIASARIFLKEKLQPRFLLWAGLAMVSAYLISFKNLQVTAAAGGATALAALLAIGAGMAWGTSTALSKVFLKRVQFLTGTALRFLATPVFALLFVILFGQTASLGAVTAAQLQTLFLITGSTGLVALAIYYYGLKQIPARVATICELTWPASAVVIDYVVFGNRFSLTQILGVGLLAVALYKINRQTAHD